MNAWVTIRNLWQAGNYWVRWAILILALWPVYIALAAFTGSQAFTAIVALPPLLVIVFGIIATFDPLVIAAVGGFALGRKFLAVLATIIGAELAIGVFFSVVPVANDRGLIPLALLAMIAIIFFVMGGIKGKMVSLLTMVLTGIAVVAFMGGRDEASAKAASFLNSPVSATASTGVMKFAAGETKAAEAQTPPRTWLNICTNKPVLVSVDGGSSFPFRLDPPCSLSEGGKKKKTMGDNNSGTYYFKAMPGEKMAQVTISYVAK